MSQKIFLGQNLAEIVGSKKASKTKQIWKILRLRIFCLNAKKFLNGFRRKCWNAKNWAEVEKTWLFWAQEELELSLLSNGNFWNDPRQLLTWLIGLEYNCRWRGPHSTEDMLYASHPAALGLYFCMIISHVRFWCNNFVFQNITSFQQE